MNKNTIQKKFIIILVIVLLLSFLCPKSVHAWPNWNSMAGSALNGIYAIPRGLLKLMHVAMCDDTHKYNYDSSNMANTKVYISPETIIKGKFVLLEADIFKKIDTSSTEFRGADYYDAGRTGTVDARIDFRNTISGWYVALRDLTVVGLLCVLVYIGIRMVLSTISSDKAKYKRMLKDWFVGLCLVVFMHYIMMCTLDISQKITKAVSSGGSSDVSNSLMIKQMNIITGVINELRAADEGDDIDSITFPYDGEEYDWQDAIAYIIVFVVVSIITLLYLFRYFKRAIVIIFLSLLAPITCITYPVDKVGDRKVTSI